jgi:hypothetical protein
MFLNKSDDQINCNNIYICPVSLRCREIVSKLVVLQHIKIQNTSNFVIHYNLCGITVIRNCSLNLYIVNPCYTRAWGSVVFKALRYKSEGPGIDSRCFFRGI